MISFYRIIFWVFVSLAAFAPTALADITQYKTIYEDSSLRFIAVQNNAPIEGQFTDFTANIVFDPQALDQSHVEVRVPIAGLYVADTETLETLKQAEWFDVNAFPVASFTSSQFTALAEDNSYQVDGVLTLKNISKPISLQFLLQNKTANRVVAIGKTILKRNDFTVGWADTESVHNDVRVVFTIHADKQ